MLTWKQLHYEMENCQQMPEMSVKQHGESVYRYYGQLDEMLSSPKGILVRETFWEKLEWRLPDWFLKYQEDLAWERYDSSIFYWYLKYHDLGKPFCQTIDADGHRHFPNHARKSFEIWKQINQDDPLPESVLMSPERIEIIGDLILHDMDLHIMNAEQVDQLIKELGSMKMITLLLAALSEIHSNAAMFGGISSTSFKIKWKQIDRRGNQICRKLFGEKHE